MKVNLNQAVLTKQGAIGPGEVEVSDEQAKDFTARQLVVEAPKADTKDSETSKAPASKGSK